MDSTQIQNYSNLPSVTTAGQLAKLIDPEVKYENNFGKFILLNITPTLKDEDNRDRRIPYNAIRNTSRSDGATQVVQSNYIELEIPKYMFPIKEIKVINKTTRSDGYLASIESKTEIVYEPYTYGQLFIVSNIGGNLDNPRIIGVYNNDSKQPNRS